MKVYNTSSGLNADFYPEAVGKLNNENTDPNALPGVSLSVDDLGYIKQGKTVSDGFTPTQAQLDAMNSGITSEDVEQINTNKNNILMLESMNGAKNLAKVASGTKTGSGYFLTNAANTLTIPQNTTVYICFDYYVPSGQVSLQLTNSNGDILSGTGVYTPTGSLIGHKVQKVTPTTNYAKGYNAYSNSSETVQINNIMIVPADIYEAGFTDYQPYCMTNAEITAWILSQS